MWLPKFFYETIPYFFIAVGVVGLVTALNLDDWYWPEIVAGGSLVSLVIGLMLVLRRKGYRSSRSRLDFDESS